MKIQLLVSEELEAMMWMTYFAFLLSSQEPAQLWIVANNSGSSAAVSSIDILFSLGCSFSVN